jgi:hypothetical protein
LRSNDTIITDDQFYKITTIADSLNYFIGNKNSHKGVSALLNRCQKILKDPCSPVEKNKDKDVFSIFIDEVTEMAEMMIKYLPFRETYRDAIFTKIIRHEEIRAIELLAILLYLKNDLKTEEQTSYVQKILRSYEKSLNQYRSSKNAKC